MANSTPITAGHGSFSLAGNTYTISAAGAALENGKPIPAGGRTVSMLLFRDTVYAQDGGSLLWYTWDQTKWSPIAPPPDAPLPVPHVIGSGADSLLLVLSGDSYQGNPKFTCAVDGKQQGTGYPVTAVHSAGQSQSFTFKGNFGPGQHLVSVRFTNDTSAGAGKDRNLYILHANFNGVEVQHGASMYINQTVHFPVTGSGPTPPPPPPPVSKTITGITLSGHSFVMTP